MLKKMFIMFSILLTINLALASSASEDLNINVTSLDKIIQLNDGFSSSDITWSPTGQYLLGTYGKSDSPSNNTVRHYLFDINSHTFGKIDYGIRDSYTNGILQAKWTPYGDQIYFGVSRSMNGYCFVFCNPDGTNLKCAGTNFTDLSKILQNIGDIGFQRNLKWSTDSSKIVFEWQKPKTTSENIKICIANRDGTNVSELPWSPRLSVSNPQPAFYDSSKIFILGGVPNEGTVVLINDDGDSIQTFQPEKKDEKYYAFSLSPDRQKILFVSGSPDSYDFQTYISNIGGSKLKGNISYYDGDNPEDTDFLTKEYWQPNGSHLLVNQNGNLYIIEGEENNKRLLYKGNASEPKWFPGGKKYYLLKIKTNYIQLMMMEQILLLSQILDRYQLINGDIMAMVSILQ
jgi:Tol biopolymer transport system component